MKDRSGQPLPGVMVEVLERRGDWYSSVFSSSMVTDDQGSAPFFDLTLELAQSYVAVVTGGLPATDVEGPDERFALVESWDPQVFPQSLTLDLSQEEWVRVGLMPQDEQGELLTQPFAFIYTQAEDSAWMQLPLQTDRWRPGEGSSFPVWLPTGMTCFVFVYTYSAEAPQYYLFSDQVTLSGASLSLPLGGSGNLIPLQVQLDAERALTLDSLELSSNESVASAWFAAGQPIYVTPGVLQLFVYARQEVDSQTWEYRLAREVRLTAGEGATLVTVGGDFAAQLQLDAAAYEPGGQITAVADIQDAYGNRLVETNEDWEPISPVITILDPLGQEIHRAEVFIPDQPVTYHLPDTAESGTYTALLELEAGPIGTLRASQDFAVAGLGAPTLSVKPLTNQTTVDVSGTAPAGATGVVVSYTRAEDEAAGEAGSGPVEAGNFSFPVTLPAQSGTYLLTAKATVGEAEGLSSAAVSLVLDLDRPGAPTGFSAVPAGENQVDLAWRAPADEDVVQYEVSRDSVVVCTVAAPATACQEQVAPGEGFEYSLVAIDRAGNRSDPVLAVVGVDTVPPNPPSGLAAALEGHAVVTLTWFPATDPYGQVSSYDVFRQAGEGIEQLVTDPALDAAAVCATVDQESICTYADQGLNAETAYTYRVKAVDSAENRSEFSQPVAVETPAITVTAVRISVPRLPTGQAIPDSRMTILLSGDPGRTATAEVTYRAYDSEGLAQLHTAILNPDGPEGQPGQYRFSFTLPEGTAELVSVKGILRDAAEHNTTLDAPFLPIEVAGSLTVSVANVQAGYQLRAYSASTGSAANVGLSDESTPLQLQRLAPADDYVVEITDQNGVVRAQQGSVMVRPGRETSLTLTLPALATLQLRLLLDGRPLIRFARPLTITASGGGDRTQVAVDDEDGTTQVLSGFHAGDVVVVTASGRLPFYAVAEEITLDAGANLVSIEVGVRDRSDLTGFITQDGLPVQASVHASQQIDGEQVILRTEVYPDGHFLIRDVYDGPVTLYAWSEGAAFLGRPIASDPVTITAPTSTPIELVLEPMQIGRISVELLLQRAAEARVEQVAMTAFTAMVYQVEVTDPRGREYGVAGFRAPQGEYPVPIQGRPGEVVTVCVNGAADGLPAACQNVTLDEAASGTARFHLVHEGGQVRGRLVDPSNPAAAWWWWNGTLYKVDDLDRHAVVGTVSAEAGVFGVRISQPGKYRLEFSAFTLDRPRTVVRDFVLAQGQDLDLGEIVLQPAGHFAGQPGNSLLATPSESVSGGIVTARANYRNGGEGPVSDAAMLLELSAGLSLVEGSLTVDGRSVTPTLGSDGYRVPIGTISPNQSGVVRYQAQIAADFNGTATATVRMEYARGSHSETELVGTTPIQAPGLTLEAPERVDQHDLTLVGRAPAGSVVWLYDGAVLLGEAQAREGGYWHLPVTLPDRGSPATHRLSVRSADQSPAEAILVYDENQPVLTEVRMYNRAKSVTWRPPEGKPQFSFPWEPNLVTHCDLTFTRPDLVYDVTVTFATAGDPLTIPAMRVAGDLFRASSILPDTSKEIYIAYKTLPDYRAEFGREAPPTGEDLLPYLPAISRDYTEPVIDPPVGPALGTTGPVSQTVHYSLPELGDTPVTATLSIETGVDYSPNALDRAAFERTGIPVHGVTWSWGPDENGNLQAKLVAYIPSEYLPAADVRLAARTLQGLGPVVPPAMRMRAIGSFSRVALSVDSGLKVADAWGNITAPIGVLERVGSYQRLFDGLWKCGPQNVTDHLSDMAVIGVEIVGAEVLKGAVAIVGALLAPATFGLGSIAVWTAGALLSAAIDAKVDADMDAMAQHVNRKAQTCQESAADPYWLIDPSGYVFEGVPENRLPGVTATVLKQDPTTGAWEEWDAAQFGQTSPQITDEEGRYGWFVPPGWWKVNYEKAGYIPTESWSMEVPPPRTDVNVGMLSTAPPTVERIAPAADGGSVLIAFSKYMMVGTLNEATVMISLQGDPLPIVGRVTAIQPAEAHDGSMLARAVRLTPEQPLAPGTTYTARVSQAVQSYARITMTADVETDFTLAQADQEGPTVSNQTPSPGTEIGRPLPVLAAEVTDPSGIDWSSTTLTLDGQAVDFTYDLGTGTLQYSPVAALADGTHRVELRVADLLGNPSTATWSFVVDGSGPVLTVRATPSTVQGTGPVTITVTSDEELAAAPLVAVTAEEKAARFVTLMASGDAGTQWSGTFSLARPVTVPTIYVITATARDRLGHQGGGRSSFTARPVSSNGGGGGGGSQPADVARPSIGGLTPADGSFVNILRPLIGAAISGMGEATPDRIRLEVDGQAVTAEVTTAGVITYTPTRDFEQGKHSVKLTLADTAGTEIAAAWSFTVDTVAPLLTITAEPAALSAGGEVLIRVGSSEPLQKAPVVRVDADGTTTPIALQAEGEQNWIGSVTVADGPVAAVYTFTVSGADLAGNTASGSATVDYTPGPSNEMQVRLGAGDQQVRAFEGQLVLTIPGGTLPDGTMLTLRQEEVPGAGPGLIPVSPAHTIQLSGGGGVGGATTLGLAFDRTPLRGLDLRKLGIYRQAGTGWIYAGGLVDTGEGLVQIPLYEPGTYAVMVYDQSFADLQGHWSQSEVEVLVSRHLVNGVSSAQFEPDRSITRAELAKLLVAMLAADPGRAIAIEGVTQPTFSDVAPDAWYYAYVETAARLGLVQGSEGRFRPDDPVTREEMAAMILRAMGLEQEARQVSGAPLPYADAAAVSDWARGYMALATTRGLITGISPETLLPKGEATRAQSAVVILRAMDGMGLISQPGSAPVRGS